VRASWFYYARQIFYCFIWLELYTNLTLGLLWTEFPTSGKWEIYIFHKTYMCSPKALPETRNPTHALKAKALLLSNDQYVHTHTKAQAHIAEVTAATRSRIQETNTTAESSNWPGIVFTSSCHSLLTFSPFNLHGLDAGSSTQGDRLPGKFLRDWWFVSSNLKVPCTPSLLHTLLAAITPDMYDMSEQHARKLSQTSDRGKATNTDVAQYQ
jgi:hypothetical protein